MSEEYPPRMDTRTAARFVGLSARSLEKRRCAATSDPPFLKIGRKVVYDRQTLIEWLASKSAPDATADSSVRRQGIA